jgi:hypothetical protein
METTAHVSSPTTTTTSRTNRSSSLLLSTPRSGAAESLGGASRSCRSNKNKDTTLEGNVGGASSSKKENSVEVASSSSSSLSSFSSSCALRTAVRKQPARTSSLTSQAAPQRRTASSSSSTRRSIAFGDDDDDGDNADSSSSNKSTSNLTAGASRTESDKNEPSPATADVGTAATDPTATARGRNRKRGTAATIGPSGDHVRGDKDGGGGAGKKAKRNESSASKWCRDHLGDDNAADSSSSTIMEVSTTLLCESSLPIHVQSTAASSSLLLAPPPSSSALSPLSNLPSVAHSSSEASEGVHNLALAGASSATTASSSLFGSVMASAHKAAAAAVATGFEGASRRGQEPSEARAEPSNDRTPVKSNVSSTGAAQAIAPTAPDASAMMMMSPGGFKILDFLHTVHNQSPMAHVVTTRNNHKPSSQHSLSSPLAATTSTAPQASRAPSTPSSSRHDDEEEDGWRDVNLDEPIVDWAVYRTLQVEVGDAAIAPGVLPLANLDVEQEARSRFMADRAMLSSSRAAVQWRSSLLYWSLPRSTCRVQYQLTTGTSSLSAKAAATKSGALTTEGKTLVHSHSSSSNLLAKDLSRAALDPPTLSSAKTGAPPFLLSRSSMLDGKDQSSGGLGAIAMDDAARRWQAAFRSLYRTWVREMVRHQEAIGSTATADIEESYFYAMGNGHSILFCATVQCDDKENGNPSSPISKGRIIEPQVVISSSTAALRNKLREMGVTQMRLLDRWDGHSTTEDFQESWLTIPARSKHVSSSRTKDGVEGKSSSPTSQSKLTSSPLEMSSPDVRAELAALRRAQALRQTVGASISVSTAAPKSSQGKPVAAPDRIPPLVVAGWDECATFVEVYLNTLGLQLMEGEGGLPSSSGKNGEAQHGREVDLPTLSCRRLGPFHHSCMESLSEKRETNGTVTLRGTILPCAVRELVASTVRLVKDSQSAASTAVASKASDSTQGTSRQRSSRSPPSAMPSSQHAIFRLQVHPGWPVVASANASTSTGIASSRPRGGAGRIGVCGTTFMNASQGPRHTLSPSGKSRRKYRLRFGQVLTTVVWDSEAGHLISHRVLDHRQSGALL